MQTLPLSKDEVILKNCVFHFFFVLRWENINVKGENKNHEENHSDDGFGYGFADICGM